MQRRGLHGEGRGRDHSRERSPTISSRHQTTIMGAFGALHRGHEEGAAKELSDLRQMAKVREIRTALAGKLGGGAARA